MKPTAWDISVIVMQLIGIAGYVVAFFAIRNYHKQRERDRKEELEQKIKEIEKSDWTRKRH